MIAFVLYGSAGLMTLAYMTWRIAWHEGGESSAALHIAKPLFEQIKNLWGTFITYLLIATFAIALPIGFVVIWPLALLLELMISGRRKEMKKEETSGVMNPASKNSVEQELALLMNNRKMIDDAITERQQTLARMIATRDPNSQH